MIPKQQIRIKITDVTDIADFYRVQDHGRLTAVHISKHSPSHHVETLSKSRSVVDCARVQAFVCVVCGMCGVRVLCVCMRMCMCRVVCCACVLKWLCVCVESVCVVYVLRVCVGMYVLCFGVVVYCRLCCVCCVWCTCVGLCVGLCLCVCAVWCVSGAAWHAEKPRV